MTLLDKILQHPDVVKQPDGNGEAVAWCPWHPDRGGAKPNLGINVKKKIVKCWVCGGSGIRALAEAWDILKPRAPRDDPEATFDYLDHLGHLLFQVVRFPGKKFAQRQPKADGGWAWDLRGVGRVVYNLPRIMQTSPEQIVYIVEGEKDADRLGTLGLVATTNAGGAGKWRREYNDTFAGRSVVIIPDNDKPGRDHAESVARQLAPVAAEIRVLHLGGEEKADISDWLDSGNGLAELSRALEAASIRTAVAIAESSSNGSRPTPVFWSQTHWVATSVEIIDRLKGNGFFVRTDDARHYYFDTQSKRLCELASFDLLVILRERYGVSVNEPLFKYLDAEMSIEAEVRGERAQARQLGHYEPEANALYLDQHDGNVLKILPDSLTVQDNGTDGVLFVKTPGGDPWTYHPEAAEGYLVAETLIEPLQFVTDEGAAYTADEQRILMLVWLLSLAFGSVQPTRPVALAVGPSGAGKSCLFRRIGRMLIGHRYEVDALDRAKEENFWLAVTSRPLVTYDNADTFVPWLNDALAQASTGIAVTKRELYKTHQAATFSAGAALSLTARTPTFRREDVASRLLIFALDRLPEKTSEYDLLNGITAERDALMSNYAGMLQKALRAETPAGIDPSIRLADFARLAARIGIGLGVEQEILTILGRLRSSQMTFATEQNTLFLLLDSWLTRPVPAEQGSLEQPTNTERRVTSTELFKELKTVADREQVRWNVSNPRAFGRVVSNMAEEIESQFLFNTGHGNKGNWYTFAPREDV